MDTECGRYARVTIEDAEGSRSRACPRHGVTALEGLAGARVIWDDTRGTNEHESAALRIAEERSLLSGTGHSGMSAPAGHGPSSGTQDGRPAERQPTVNKVLTPGRARPVVENPEYTAFARRILRACGRRIAAGDIESLALMAELADTIDASIRDAVTGLRARGYSWADIGSRLGVTRQAAQQRWGNRLL
jgi:hypothetical protein